MENQGGGQRLWVAALPTLIVVLIVAAVVLAISTTMPSVEAARLTSEGGFIETLTVALYLVAACVLLIGSRAAAFLPEALVLSAPLSLLALREMDFHVRFTTMGIFKSRYYLSPQVPLFEKLAVIILLVPIAWLGLFTLWHFGRRFLSAMRALHPGAIAVLAGCGLLVLSKLIDGLNRMMGKLGLKAFHDEWVVFLTIEEVFELGAALMMIAAAFAWSASPAARAV